MLLRQQWALLSSHEVGSLSVYMKKTFLDASIHHTIFPSIEAMICNRFSRAKISLDRRRALESISLLVAHGGTERACTKSTIDQLTPSLLLYLSFEYLCFRVWIGRSAYTWESFVKVGWQLPLKRAEVDTRWPTPIVLVRHAVVERQTLLWQLC